MKLRKYIAAVLLGIECVCKCSGYLMVNGLTALTDCFTSYTCSCLAQQKHILPPELVPILETLCAAKKVYVGDM